MTSKLLLAAFSASLLLGAAHGAMAADAAKPAPLKITPAVLKAYMENFDPTFLALIPTPEQLAVMAKDFKIYYKKVEGKTPTSYTMDHSAGSYVFDTQGKLRLFTRYGTGAKPLAQDIAILLKQG